MIAALVSFKSPLATRPMTSTRSSSRLLMAVLFNQTSSGWRSQSKGTFLISSEGDIIIKFQQAVFKIEPSRTPNPRKSGQSRPNHNKRLLPGRDRVGERGVGWVVGEVFFAGEEARKGASLLRIVDAWPTQARFWLEWGCFFSILSSRPELIIAKMVILRSEGPDVVTSTGSKRRIEIESEWTTRKRERTAGTLCPAVELSTQAKTGLEWATSPGALNLLIGPRGLPSRWCLEP